MRSVAVTLLVLALLGGSAAALAVTEALKLERSPIAGPRFTKRFSPVCSCERETAELVFRLRRSDELEAVVVDDEGDAVRTLLAGAERRRGLVSLSWDGRDDDGRIAVDGRYRLRVHLARERRTILMPNPVFLDTSRPSVRIVDVVRKTFSPDGDGRNDVVEIAYVASESARAVVLVDGAVAGAGRLHRKGTATVTWDGATRAGTAGAGTHLLALQARDRAGNLSQPSPPVTVTVRFIQVEPGLLIARRGGELRFRVGSDARTFSWRLLQRGRTLLAGTARPGALSVALPLRLRAGRYLLRVEENGRIDRARVRILRGRS